MRRVGACPQTVPQTAPVSVGAKGQSRGGRAVDEDSRPRVHELAACFQQVGSLVGPLHDPGRVGQGRLGHLADLARLGAPGPERGPQTVGRETFDAGETCSTVRWTASARSATGNTSPEPPAVAAGLVERVHRHRRQRHHMQPAGLGALTGHGPRSWYRDRSPPIPRLRASPLRTTVAAMNHRHATLGRQIPSVASSLASAAATSPKGRLAKCLVGGAVAGQRRGQRRAGGVLAAVARAHRPAHDRAHPGLDLAGGLALGVPDRQQDTHQVGGRDLIDGYGADVGGRRSAAARTASSPRTCRRPSSRPRWGCDHPLDGLGEGGGGGVPPQTRWGSPPARAILRYS